MALRPAKLGEGGAGPGGGQNPAVLTKQPSLCVEEGLLLLPAADS